MSRTLNKVMLIGNVGRDPEVKFTPSGVKVAQVRMATSESWKDKDGVMKERTDWHTIIAWRGLADIVEQMVHRGTRLYVEGKIQSRSFEDREGNKRYITEIIADNLLILDARRPDNHTDTESPAASAEQRPTQGDDIPF
jgi:single-strand DNA-binding protein